MKKSDLTRDEVSLTSISHEVESLLHRIYRHIATQPIDSNLSLLTGQLGYALFESYYHRHFGISDDARLWERISTGLDAISEGELIHSFAGGISGITWAFLHLCNHSLLPDTEVNAHDIVEDLDKPLFEVSMEYLKEGDSDYLHGGLSACLYFLERRRTKRIEKYITQLVAQLESISVKMPNGDITWRTTNLGYDPEQIPVMYNLSLSHGAASIVAVLSLLYEKGYARESCAHLVHGALQWMWNVRNQNDTSVFPNWVSDTPADQHSRLAWCYGDLGIASAFHLAGDKLHHRPWQEIAKATMQKAASRRNPEDVIVRDSGICHGSAGLAHLFRSFAQSQPSGLFSEAAHYWLQYTIRQALPEKEAYIFLQYHPEDQKNPYWPNLSLLTGEAGIGIVLLSALGAPSAWERLLLLS